MAVIPFAKEKPERQLTSWIESFLEATEGLPVPRIFLKWSAISAIAGALERKVWVRMNRMNLYPNMYILLIADPGVGKTVSATQTEILWRGLKNHHVAPTNATKAGLIDVLAESAREVTLPRLAGVDKFHALNIMASELGAFMPSYEGEFMNTLTTLWDGGHYSERKRTGQLKVDIPKPTLNMLACATPDFMNKFMPEGAWKQGFASRLLMIYSSEMILSDLWSEDNHASAMGTYYDDLQSDLVHIGNIYGKIEFAPEAAETFTRWYRSGTEPLPQHPKLESYVPRRPVHLANMCMVRAISERRMVILQEDYSWCLDTLIQAEAAMPDIFLSMKGGQSQAMDDLWHFVLMAQAKEKKPIDEGRLVNFLRERIPSGEVMRSIDLMVRGGQLKAGIGPAGRTVYSPAPRGKNY
jgi:hypothetical protein